MEILMIPTYVIMARVLIMMILILFASGKLAESLKRKHGDENIMNKIVSAENILALSAYLILFYVLSFIWPLGWEVFNSTSGVFWPVQGLVILAIIGWFCLERLKFLPWFFLIMAVALTVTGMMRDPRIYEAIAEQKADLPSEEEPPPLISSETTPQQKEDSGTTVPPYPEQIRQDTVRPETIAPIPEHLPAYEAKKDGVINDTLWVFVPAKGNGRSNPVFIEWGQRNELRKEPDRYYVRMQQGYQYRARPLRCVRVFLPDDSHYDQCPQDFRYTGGSHLNWKRVYEDTTGQATNVLFTLEPQK